MHKDDALALACGTLCLQVHAILPEVMKKLAVQSDRIGPSDLTTWLVKGSRFFTLIQTSSGTRVYDHDGDYLYYANPNTELARECPEGHAFLAQTVEDKTGASVTCRLLIMDIVWPKIDNPRKRGEILRSMGQLFPPSCHVQWSGDRAALESFLSNGMPHDVECIVALREPGRLYREPPAHGIRVLEMMEMNI
jgi:hypothetical protein